MKIAGIDLSLNSTGIYLYDTVSKEFTFFNIYKNLSKKRELELAEVPNLQLVKLNIIDANDELERLKVLKETASQIFSIVKNCECVAIEGIAFNATGSKFHEVVGLHFLLKDKLLSNGIKFKTYAPTTIKKFIGNGRYKKDDIIQIFNSTPSKESSLLSPLGFKKPVDDLVDAYYITKKLESDI